MLDDLRRSASDDDFQEADDEFGFEDDFGAAIDDSPSGGGGRRRFMGMTAVERMFLSIFLFLNVLVIGFALLLATGRL